LTSGPTDAAIVVTGVGAITALGTTARETWERVLRGERAFAPISLFPADDYRVRLVAEVSGLRKEGPPDYSRTSELAVMAAREALGSAGLGETTGRPARFGLVVGGSTAGMLEAEHALAMLVDAEGKVDEGARTQALRHMLSHPLSAPGDRIARELGPFCRVRSLSSACSSGANALLVGATWLELGLVDAVLYGASDALCRVTLSGFNALGALDPEGARPFDRRRRGLTLGEGAGFVVLERASAAAARGGKALSSLLGWSARAEAHHITNPEPNGTAPSRAMAAALARAGLEASAIDYVNAHGTGTPLNDPMETRALARVFGEGLGRVAVSSQKGQFGHTLAASGAIEAVLTTLAIAEGIVPPTGGLEEPDPQCALAHVREPLPRNIRAAMSSSFGFGGMDTVLVLGRADLRSPRVPAPRRVVVTGAAAVTPDGLFDAKDLPAMASGGPPAGELVTVDPDLHLDADRARRLDRASRLASIVSERALADASGAAGERGPHAISERSRDAGVVLGAAFGAVDTTAAFMRRLRDKGPRLASPADFPSLVPSSPAGYVSIYLGLSGPTLAVADLAVSGESAFTQGFELVAAGETDRVAVVAVEERSIIVDQVFRVLFPPERRDGPERQPRREGAAAVALAAEEVAAARDLPVLARVRAVVAWTDALPLDDGASLDVAVDRAVVLTAGTRAATTATLDASSWAGCRRIDCAERAGSHEGAGGFALALAASMVARGDVDRALAIGVARGFGYAIVLEPGGLPPGPGRPGDLPPGPGQPGGLPPGPGRPGAGPAP